MLLSIVIPTKNRTHTLFPVLRNILENINGDFEVIIQDNSDEKVAIPIELIAFNKINHFYTPGHIPISDNTELALSNACGEFILFIGDDDFVSPRIMDVVSIMKQKSIDNMTYDAGYYWWDSVQFYKKNYYHDNKKLWLPKNRSMNISVKYSEEELIKYYGRGGVSIGGLPRVYHGITKKSVLERIKQRTGKYVVGSCPDISLAISLTLVLEEFHTINWPLSLYGASSGSGGGMTASKKHYAKIEDMNWLREGIKERWHKNIPELWSERTIYPQTATEVFSAFCVEHEIDFYEMYAALFAYEPHLKTYWISGYKKTGMERLGILSFKILKKVIGQLVSKIKYDARILPYEVKVVEVENVSKYF